MGGLKEIELGSVQETLFLPLWGRAIETQKKKPLLIDNKALSIINSIPYDFTVMSKNINKVVQASWVARSIFFDKKIKAFIDVYPEATIANIGCGLDTTFDRVDNGKIQWIDLDLPDTIDLRKKFISESNRRHFIPKSVFDQSWYNSIDKKDKVMLLIAGVLCYFSESDVKRLFNDFHTFIPGAEVVFDYFSAIGMKVSNKKVIENGGMDKSAYLKWSIDNILEIERWDSNIKILSYMPMYREHKKNFSMLERIGMTIADMLKIVSLTHIKIK
ncbi:MAG: class I SAM-dependent methyltransferase [Deltaproteobacteria bacterium]|nr:class I SAM-dependent methyltransferase [Deltaproteobacteria bacterium]